MRVERGGLVGRTWGDWFYKIIPRTACDWDNNEGRSENGNFQSSHVVEVQMVILSPVIDHLQAAALYVCVC